ncbi:MAG TPA: N-acetyl-gamma-glutamyl-phosphate reductase [Streptosporangiaceae bacterium]|jgi:N-acetyl-gamma-glutamyl-phosphate reductase|nr:N-acetyl-gamma-glutamyl-phosphate reductase [Streptosporangiaceae bacterium]
MGARVAVAGASGYAGGELLRLLSAHPDLEIGALGAGSNAGAPVTAVHPNLITLAGRTFGPTTPEAFAGSDLVFMALPHGEAAALAAELPEQTKVVDLGAGFRLADPASWKRFYGGDHPGTWTYGLPELPGARASISAASRVASPGCFATASILALAPLLASGAAEPGDIVIVAASGTSGAGRSATVNLLGSEVMGSVSAYKVGGVHRHTPEIEEALQSVLPGPGPRVTISFTPTLAPMPRGILATATARLAGDAGPEQLREAFAASYGREPFVHLLPEGQWPGTGATSGSNAAQLQVAADQHAGRAVVVSAIDNLGKGAAGQALQNANLMLGLPETAGLTAQGVAP